MNELLKQLFGTKAMTYSEFIGAVETKGIKLADIGAGEYVSVHKAKDMVRDAKAEGAQESKTELTKIQEQLETAQKSLKEFSGINLDEVKAFPQRIKDLEKAHATEITLMSSGARDIISVKAHLDLSKVELKDGGVLSGLDEQLTALKEGKPYLFGTGKETTTTVKATTDHKPQPATESDEELSGKLAKAMGVETATK
jgi:hypothetical protein